MKREVPSFTVEIRQQRRKPTGENGNANWADASIAALAPDTESHRVAATVFKTTTSSSGSAPRAPRSGRILPNLAEAPKAAEPNPAARIEPDRAREARRNEERSTRPRTAPRETESLEQHVARANALFAKPAAPRVVEAPARPPRAAPIVVEPPSRAQAAEPKPRAKMERRAIPSKTPRWTPEPAPAPRIEIVAAPPPPPVVESAAPARKRAIVGRYVFRDDSNPGQGWKRKLLARRENRT